MVKPSSHRASRIAAGAAVATFVLGVSALTPVRAADYPLGTLAIGEVDGDTGDVKVAAGPISDTYDFTLVGTGAVSAEVDSFIAHLGTKVTQNITGLTLTLTGPNVSTSVSGGTELDYSGLVPGSYVLAVTGTATGTKGGTYDLGYSIVSAVPLPGGLALFGTGMLFLGGIGWRYGRKSAV